MIPTCLQIFVSCSSIRISSFTHFLAQYAFLSYQSCILLFSPLAGILSKLISNLHPSFFYHAAFSIFLFPTNLPNGSSCFGFSKEPARWGLRKTMLPATRVCHPHSICGLRTGTCWSINIHICLAAVSWSVSPTATSTRTVISQDWLSRGVLL